MTHQIYLHTYTETEKEQKFDKMATNWQIKGESIQVFFFLCLQLSCGFEIFEVNRWEITNYDFHNVKKQNRKKENDSIYIVFYEGKEKI